MKIEKHACFVCALLRYEHFGTIQRTLAGKTTLLTAGILSTDPRLVSLGIDLLLGHILFLISYNNVYKSYL